MSLVKIPENVKSMKESNFLDNCLFTTKNLAFEVPYEILH